jgi:hypothetical protein
MKYGVQICIFKRSRTSSVASEGLTGASFWFKLRIEVMFQTGQKSGTMMPVRFFTPTTKPIEDETIYVNVKTSRRNQLLLRHTASDKSWNHLGVGSSTANYFVVAQNTFSSVVKVTEMPKQIVPSKKWIKSQRRIRFSYHASPLCGLCTSVE